MADGHALIEFNLEGKGRLKEVNYFDFRLKYLDLDMDDAYTMLQEQFPKDLKDVLVMAFFRYESVDVSSYWEKDFEDVFTLDTLVITKENYKEFYREMVTESLNVHNGLPLFDQTIDKQYMKEEIASWEELYDEDFVPYDKKK